MVVDLFRCSTVFFIVSITLRARTFLHADLDALVPNACLSPEKSPTVDDKTSEFSEHSAISDEGCNYGVIHVSITMDATTES